MLALCCVLISLHSYAQNTDKTEQEAKAVRKVIDTLFEGMEKGDSDLVRSAFSEQAEMYSVFTDRSGKPVLHQGTLIEFLKSVGTPHDVEWNEEIWNVEIRIDGHLAQVWAEYAFYADDKFSHCGVDAFHLFKSEAGWKIFHITDTRNWQNCDVPEEIQRKY
ncbi:nuclear transport factor 2 family protein [Fulvivirga maritima]|uniref:nuclear transport factor 2 family protein n=1 Tax=Fulvivirga maritima TaxID=2904247 RepID=UPI001F18AA0F|nr:nuclear transport factor 2 family protein [Fulvivirga maritima]UII27039.1 nuclear transport factor 2 family protein [Fulvivirga maritima]